MEGLLSTGPTKSSYYPAINHPLGKKFTLRIHVYIIVISFIKSCAVSKSFFLNVYDEATWVVLVLVQSIVPPWVEVGGEEMRGLYPGWRWMGGLESRLL